MKKSTYFLIVVLSAFIMGACSGGSGDPKSSAEGYLAAISKTDFKKAAGYCTGTALENTQEQMNMMDELGPMVAAVAKQFKQSYKVTDVQTDGDNATVKYSGTMSMGEGMDFNIDGTMRMVKENGKWLIAEVEQDNGM